jgi:glycosyltransferase involved in cell wall biosynthesis
MRIVIDMQGAQLDKNPRGIGRYAVCMARAIIANKKQHEIILMLNAEFPHSAAQLHAEFEALLPSDQIVVWEPIFSSQKKYLKTKWRIHVDDCYREAFIASLKPDLVYLVSFFGSSHAGFHCTIGYFPRSYPVVATLHDLIPLSFPELYLDPYPWSKEPYMTQIENLKKADAWLTISDFSAEEGVRLLGLDPERVYNASEGSDAFFHPFKLSDSDARSLLERFGIQDQFLMYVGGADPRKNLPRLIQAYAKVDQRLRKHCQLVIAGGISSSIQKQLSKTMMQSGLKQSEVVFAGYLSDEELRSLYLLTQAFVFPTLSEGFGLPALEAMSCGTAVIASGCSSLTEVIANPDAYFDPYSIDSMTAKMTHILTDEKFRQNLISSGLEQAKKFSWDESGKRALAFFEELQKSAQFSTMENPDLTDELISRFVWDNYPPTSQELMVIAKALDKFARV